MSSPAPREPERRAGFASVAGFAVLSVYFTGFFPPFGNPNELSRLEAVYAFVEQGTFSIDRAIPVLGNHEDKAISAGRFYSNKAPGLTFAAIPVYRALRIFFPAPRSPWDAVFVLVRILTVSLLYTLALARFVARLPPGKGAGLLVFAVAFGTPLLFYGRSFFGHAWTAALLFLAWDLLRMGEERRPASGARLLALAAGLLAGWAAISEYDAAPLALLLALRAAARGSWKAFALVAAGAAIPLLLLLSYNATCFGSPWILSSAREAYPDFATMSGKGLFGFGLPSPRVAWDFLFHPARGLLLFSPFLLWVIPGFAAWWRSREDRADCVFALAAVAALFLILTAYPNWHGGWTLGDRYLLPALFFAGLAAARGLASATSRGLFAAAALFSAVNHFLLAASWPYFPLELRWPVATGSLWFLSRGWIAPNLLSRAGWVSLL
ncbi:MAG TPA: hypothetical protein VK416_09745, partial [Thermoanaerobaculia bacterium]|nr:hypothetical protein [Thermoanaerobaculia bacterium]